MEFLRRLAELFLNMMWKCSFTHRKTGQVSFSNSLSKWLAGVNAAPGLYFTGFHPSYPNGVIFLGRNP
jgi:hypothetical protein